MKNYLIYYLFITLSIIVNSCSEGFKDEPIKYATTVCSSGWQLIAKHVDPDNFTDGTDVLFNANAYNTFLENEGDNSSNTFMSIGNLTESNYVCDGKYKFKLEWDGLTVASSGINKEVIWTQTSWLTSSTITDFDEIGDAGFASNDPNGLLAVTNFVGLGKSGHPDRCVLDGNGNIGGTWNCVGAIRRYGNGFPGPYPRQASSMKLYIWKP